MPRTVHNLLAILATLTLAACGIGSPAPTPTATLTPTSTPAPTPTPSPMPTPATTEAPAPVPSPSAIPSPTPTPTPIPPPPPYCTSTPTGLTPEQIVECSRSAMASVTSYRWTTDVDFKFDPDDLPPSLPVGPNTFRIDGIWQGPFDYQTTFTSTDGSEIASNVLIFSGTLDAILEKRDGQWRQIVYHALPLIPRMMGRDYQEELPNFDTLAFGPTGSDSTAFHLTGVSADPYGPDEMTTYVMAIDPQTYRLLTLTLTSGDSNSFTMTSTFYDYNAPLTIDLPTEWTPLPEGMY